MWSSEGTALPQRLLLPPEKVGMAWQQQTGSVGAGLSSLGNPCFLNTVLQRLTLLHKVGQEPGAAAGLCQPQLSSAVAPAVRLCPPGLALCGAEPCTLPREEPLPHSRRLGRPHDHSPAPCHSRHVTPPGPVSQSMRSPTWPRITMLCPRPRGA